MLPGGARPFSTVAGEYMCPPSVTNSATCACCCNPQSAPLRFIGRVCRILKIYNVNGLEDSRAMHLRTLWQRSNRFSRVLHLCQHACLPLILFLSYFFV